MFALAYDRSSRAAAKTRLLGAFAPDRRRASPSVVSHWHGMAPEQARPRPIVCVCYSTSQMFLSKPSR